MWITSLLRGCFKRPQPASPDAGSAPAHVEQPSSDEDVPLRIKGRSSHSTATGHGEKPLLTKDAASTLVPPEVFAPLQQALSRPDLSVGRPSRPGALLTPDAMDVRSPTDGVMRTPLPLTPLPLTSPSLPSGSPTLHILRTPLPFGSPVPYPHTGNTPGSRDKAPAGAQRGGSTAWAKHRGIPCLPYTLPYELRQQEQRPAVASVGKHAPQPNSGPQSAQPEDSQALLKTPLGESCEVSNASKAQPGGYDTQTLAPLKFKLSSQGQDRTPRVSGIENPATSYKENKAVMLRHTPFAERVDKAVANEDAFRASLDRHNCSGLGKAS